MNNMMNEWHDKWITRVAEIEFSTEQNRRSSESLREIVASENRMNEMSDYIVGWKMQKSELRTLRHSLNRSLLCSHLLFVRSVAPYSCTAKALSPALSRSLTCSRALSLALSLFHSLSRSIIRSLTCSLALSLAFSLGLSFPRELQKSTQRDN